MIPLLIEAAESFFVTYYTPVNTFLAMFCKILIQEQYKYRCNINMWYYCDLFLALNVFALFCMAKQILCQA